MKLDRPNRNFWERIVLLVVFVVALVFMVNSYVKEKKFYHERGLHSQLMGLRNGISLFFLTEKHYPDSLVELAASTYKFPGDEINRRFVEKTPLSKDDKVVDPFGNPYAYNKERGLVNSTTKGYEYW